MAATYTLISDEEHARRLENYRKWNASAKQRRLAHEQKADYLPPLVEYQNCSTYCMFWNTCQEIVWHGTTLPCQPQSEPDLLNVREAGDYTNAWKGETASVLLPRRSNHKNNQVER